MMDARPFSYFLRAGADASFFVGYVSNVTYYWQLKFIVR